MIVGIHQPLYFPWIGFFDKMAKSDRFLLLDEVQMEKGSYMYRNRIIDESGKIVYLTIPGNKHGFLNRKYNEIEAKNDYDWKNDHAESIKRAYGDSLFFDEVWGNIEDLFDTEEKTICAYCIRSIKRIKEILDISTEIILQSDLEYDDNAKKNDLILSLCQKLGADRYLSGNGARKYMQDDSFAKVGIEVGYQIIQVPEYGQLHTKEFVPGLSMLDVFFNCGIKGTKELFWKTCNRGAEF